MSPMRRPIRLPKMRKYSVAVIAGGTIVWPQIRMMRLNSRMTMVWKPTMLVRARCADSTTCCAVSCWAAFCWVVMSGRSACRTCRLLFHQAHEQLLEPVGLVAHRQDLDPRAAQAREDVVQVLLLRHLDLERVVVGHGDRIAGQR